MEISVKPIQQSALAPLREGSVARLTAKDNGDHFQVRARRRRGSSVPFDCRLLLGSRRPHLDMTRSGQTTKGFYLEGLSDSVCEVMKQYGVTEIAKGSKPPAQSKLSAGPAPRCQISGA